MSLQQLISSMVEELKSTTKKNEKIQIIADYCTNSKDVELFLELVYNPYLRFFVKSVPVSEYKNTDLTGYDLQRLKTVVESGDRGEIKNFLSFLCSKDETCNQLITAMMNKDLDCGIAVATINKAVGTKLVPEYKVGKAEEQSKLDNLQLPLYSNEKIDGGRSTYTLHNDGAFEFLSSGGNTIQQINPVMVQEMDIWGQQIIQSYGLENGLQFDGEFLVVENGVRWSRQKSNGVLNKMINGNATQQEVDMMHFFVFDVLPDANAIKMGGTDLPLNKRVEMLEIGIEQLNRPFQTVSLVPYTVVETLQDIRAEMQRVLDQGGEGIIVKSMNSPYQTKRQPHWVKLKREVDVDVLVTGWTPHKKRSDMIGALCISSACGTIQGNIGTGHFLTEENRIMLKELADRGELEGLILDCCIHEITKNKAGEYSFYLPRITQIRHDKHEADDFEKIMAMF